jgi:hypothetical protein
MLNVLSPVTRSAAALLALAAFGALSMPALAQAPGAAGAPVAGVGVPPPAASSRVSPDQLLGLYPNGGAELVSRTRDMALADQTALDPIIALLAKATKDQKNAIASGLAQAARVAVRSNQAYATRIQQAIADTKDQDVVLAYAAASGDVAIAATGAGAGSAGASGGQTNGLGTPGAGGGSLESIDGSSTGTGQFSFTSSVSGVGTSTTGTTTNTSTTTLACTISP